MRCVFIWLSCVVQMVGPSGWRRRRTANWVCHRVTLRQYRTAPSLPPASRRPSPKRSIFIIARSSSYSSNSNNNSSSSSFVISCSTATLSTLELQQLSSTRNVPTGYDDNTMWIAWKKFERMEIVEHFGFINYKWMNKLLRIFPLIWSIDNLIGVHVKHLRVEVKVDLHRCQMKLKHNVTRHDLKEFSILHRECSKRG